MRYFIRSVKYFVQLMVILVIIIAVLIVAKIVPLMAAFAAIYPRFGYIKREAVVPGSDEEVLPVLRKVMEAHGYVEEPQGKDGVRAFRKKSVGDKLTRLWEDRITVTRCATGFELEGIGRDVTRLVNALRDKT